MIVLYIILWECFDRFTTLLFYYSLWSSDSSHTTSVYSTISVYHHYDFIYVISQHMQGPMKLDLLFLTQNIEKMMWMVIMQYFHSCNKTYKIGGLQALKKFWRPDKTFSSSIFSSFQTRIWYKECSWLGSAPNHDIQVSLSYNECYKAFMLVTNTVTNCMYIKK